MSLLSRVISSVGKDSTSEKLAHSSSPGVAELEFEDVRVRFVVPNKMSAWRVQHFYDKEPDTVAWLRRMPRDSILLDVGANIGIYSLAAAVGRGCRVIALEPESQNYAILNSNIVVNGASDRVTAYCAALTDKAGLNRLFLSKFEQNGGGSCHSYGEEVGFDLAPRQSPFSQGCIGLCLDDLIAQGAIPVPDFIKIDVDGFEHKVVAGALETLRNQRVKEILIEINPSIDAHKQLILTLRNLGFYYDLDQRHRAARKEGAFKNVGEVIFRRIPERHFHVSMCAKPTVNIENKVGNASGVMGRVLDHMLERVMQTPINEEPYPHIVVDDFFPMGYFHQALESFPTDEQMIPLSETGRSNYKNRLVVLFNDEHFNRLDETRRSFWEGFADWLYSERFINGMIEKFAPFVACRLADLDRGQGVKLHGDALIVSDKTNYRIGPHTDAPHRLITFLFYLPKDESQADLGTSIYRPCDESEEYSPFKHHPFELFERLSTVSFVPNRALIFVRNGHSFHGVEPITRKGIERHLVINNIRIAEYTGQPPS